MSSNDNLPVILVSAVDIAAASAMIIELINGSTEPPQTNGVGAHEEDEDVPRECGGGGVVWRLENKYYTASVRLLPCADRPALCGDRLEPEPCADRPAPSGDRPEPAPCVDRPAPCGDRPTQHSDVQAHLIYLTENECEDESACSRRAEAARTRLPRGAVRLVAARCAAPPPALCDAARRLRYELVPLVPPAPPEPDSDQEEPEPVGVERLREALHAHVWPGLARRGAARALPDLPAGDSSAESSDSDSWGDWRQADLDYDEAGAVERAEQFAAALALLHSAREAPGAPGTPGAPRTPDRLHAEQLVAAFCRALGHTLPLQPWGGGGGGGGGGDGDESGDRDGGDQ